MILDTGDYKKSRAYQLFCQGKYKQALDAIVAEREHFPDSTQASLYYLKSVCLTRLHRLDEADTILRRIPFHPFASNRLKKVALLRLCLYGLRDRDFRYARKSLALYASHEGSDQGLIAFITELTAILAGEGGCWEKVIPFFSAHPEMENIQTYLGYAIEHSGRYDLVSTFIDQFEQTTILQCPILQTAILEYYLRRKDLKKSRLWFRRRKDFPVSRLRDVVTAYYKLRLDGLQGIPRETLARGAEEVLRNLDTINTFLVKDVVLYCQSLARRIKTRWPALVSQRFGLVGEHSSIVRVRQSITRFAPTALNILICGDSGTGKELVAQAIHDHSQRSSGRFLAVNCAMLGDALAESKLFGHTRGAYTGAHTESSGLIHSARGGTLFLDEIAELPLGAQANLFRFLDSGRFTKVGSAEEESSDVRIIAASNQDLHNRDTFRHELLYRLAGVTISLPTLAERGEDILHISRYKLDELNAASPITKELSAEAEARLLAHRWPGNVRELLQCITQSWHEATCMIGPEHLHFQEPHWSSEESSSWQPDLAGDILDFDMEVRKFSSRLVTRVLEGVGGDTSDAARRLQISERTVYRWIKRGEEFCLAE